MLLYMCMNIHWKENIVRLQLNIFIYDREGREPNQMIASSRTQQWGHV